MRYRYLLTGLALIGLLVSVDTAWGGAPYDPNLGRQREENFVHICRGGPNDGGSCSVSFDTGDRVEQGCPQGNCVLVFNTPVIRGTLTLIVDEHLNVKTFQDCAACTDATNPECDPCTLKRLANVALTSLLIVSKDGRSHFFAETHVSAYDAVPYELFDGATELLIPGPSDLRKVRLEFLFLAPQGSTAQALRNLFEVTGIPVITGIGARPIIKSARERGPVGSVSQFEIEIRFVRIASPSTSQPSELMIE